MKNIILPKSLKKGDKIAIISPAGAVKKNDLYKTLDLIKSKGYQPVIGKKVYSIFNKGYEYAGNEKERIEDINWAFNDKEIKAVWASRGGYGCQHLLDNIDLKGFKKNPKWYIGYSDNTAVQSFLVKKGYASLHGQTIKTSSFGVSKESYETIFSVLKGNLPKYHVDKNKLNREGKAKGQLVGGNLALIYALLGTKYSYKFKDKILFIEEIGENFYALDRMLMSLELAGVFRQIKGLVVGGMINMGKEKENPNYEHPFDKLAYKIINDRVKKYDFPCLFGFPNGHIFDNKPLIIGANVELKVTTKHAKFKHLK